MKKKNKFYAAKSAQDLAHLLDLTLEDGIELELRSDLNAKIISVVKKHKLTHAAVAKLAGTSRTRITALLNCNTKNISTSLMIRVLASLGVKTRLTYSPIKFAA